MNTPYGTVRIAPVERLYEDLAGRLNHLQVADSGASHRVGLAGGSTPRDFYRWCVEQDAISRSCITSVIWFVSDERHVPLESEASNFGVADRLLLNPLGVDPGQKVPFPVDVDPREGARQFNGYWTDRYGTQAGFNLCLLGMGDDGHTASLFPGSPLIATGVQQNFAAVEVPDKGWRYTITEAGLGRCDEIVLLVCGAGKARRLSQVFGGEQNAREQPVQLMKQFAKKVIWLIDEEAAEGLPPEVRG